MSNGNGTVLPAADPVLDPLLRVYQVIWVQGEPVDALKRSVDTLATGVSWTTPLTSVNVWTAAQGILRSGRNPGANAEGLNPKADQELVNALLASNDASAVVIQAEGVTFGMATKAAILRALDNDSKVVIVSSARPPSDFLPTYVRTVHLNDYDIPLAIQDVCTANGFEYDASFAGPLVGITRYKAVNIFLEARKQHDGPDDVVAYLRRTRGEVIKQDTDGIITLGEPTRGYDKLIGLERAKRMLYSLTNQVKSSGIVKGVLLAGIPGGGKTQIALATAKEFDLPLYITNMGAVFESKVGESEHRMMNMLDSLRRLPSGVVLADELEKSLSSTYASASDSGVGRRIGGYILDYLNDPRSINGHHLILGTSNDPEALPPEFTRAGRWDISLWFNYPTEAARLEILELYKTEYERKAAFTKDADTSGMTGAEIESVCRVAQILNTNKWDEARQYVPILSEFRKEDIAKMQTWAKGRMVSADLDTGAPAKARRLRV